MSHTTTVRAVIDPKKKAHVDKILKQLGINHSQAINIFYSLIEIYNGLPFEVRIPSERTTRAIERLEKGENVSTYDTVEEMFEDAENW